MASRHDTNPNQRTSARGNRSQSGQRTGENISIGLCGRPTLKYRGKSHCGRCAPAIPALLLVTDTILKGWQKLVLNSELMGQRWATCSRRMHLQGW